MKKHDNTAFATIYTIGAIICMIFGLINFQGLRSIYLTVAIIFGFLSFVWINRALNE